MQAQDIMTRDVVTVEAEMPVMDVARLLAERNISGVPVVEEGEVVGIITEKDLVDRVKRVHLPTLITILDAVFPIAGEHQYEEDLRKMAAATAGDIMTEEVVSVTPDTEVEDVATVLSEKGISLLPVVDNGELAGIISKRDVIRGMLRETGV